MRWSGVQAGVDLDDSELVHLEWWSGRWRGGLGVGATAGEGVAIAAEALKGCGASTLNPLPPCQPISGPVGDGSNAYFVTILIF